ncbi:MAG: cytochrome C biogenesis protein [Chitinophagaceae bacterium]|nr:MAG: cytochrome C biogenesis protein [Chitinophagaceae bacterium]
MNLVAEVVIRKNNLKSLSHILTLVKKDLLLEIRQQYSFYGILLYIGATIFVLFVTMNEPETKVWNGLFWVVQLFICINAVAKSFLQESKGRILYFYSIVNPRDFVLAKLLFNSLFMLLMSLLSLFLFTLFMGNPIQKAGQFIGLVLLGGWGLSLIFTFLAAIAAKAQQNAAIMAILGFPIIIPQLLLLSKLSNSVFSFSTSIALPTVLLILALNILVIFLATILFPFLWKD